MLATQGCYTEVVLEEPLASNSPPQVDSEGDTVSEPPVFEQPDENLPEESPVISPTEVQEAPPLPALPTGAGALADSSTAETSPEQVDDESPADGLEESGGGLFGEANPEPLPADSEESKTPNSLFATDDSEPPSEDPSDTSSDFDLFLESVSREKAANRTDDTASDDGAPAAIESPADPTPTIEVASATASLPLPEIPSADSIAPAVSQQVDAENTRLVAWLLGDKLSYALLDQTNAQASKAALAEARQLAKVLGVEWTLPEGAVSVKQVLGLGREVGGQLTVKYSPDHAALVEIAFKTNILLSVFDRHRQFVHPIAGASAAACVRAGVADSEWKKWQQAVFAAERAEQVRDANHGLHRAIRSMLVPAASAVDPLFR